MLQINAAIAKHHHKIWCTYQTKHLRHYNAECFLIELNSDLEPIAERKLFAQNGNTAFKDIRLFSFGAKLLAFYNYLPFVEGVGWQIKYGFGYGEVDVAAGVIRNQVSLHALFKKYHEKNWVPYSWDNGLYMITDFEPYLRVVKIGQTDGGDALEEIFTAINKTQGWAFGKLKGGTPLISIPGANDGWLYGFAHSYRPDENGFKRHYYYTVIRFNHLNKSFEYHPCPLPYNDEDIDDEYEALWKQSNGKQRKVIFPIGITHHNDGILVSFGKDDVLSYTEHFLWERIKNYFN